MVPHLFIQITIGIFLKNRIQLPVIPSVNILHFYYCGLSISSVSKFLYNKKRGNSLSPIIFRIYNSDNANYFIMICNKIKKSKRLFEFCFYFLDRFVTWACIVILISGK